VYKGLFLKTLRPLKNAQFCLRSRKARILTTGIPVVFRGLEFEPDAEIGQKGVFFKGLTLGGNGIYGQCGQETAEEDQKTQIQKTEEGNEA
jgi:hypothetical protein